MRWHAWGFVLVATLSLIGLSGCAPARDSERWTRTEQETQRQPAVSENAVEGKALNDFFPRVSAPYNLVYRQEKDGFVLASLQRDGKEVGTLAITDTANEPSARDKFKSPAGQIAGFPMATSGSQGTAILINTRFQVQVRSVPGGLTPEERTKWLELFDLNGLKSFMAVPPPMTGAGAR